MAQTHGGWEQDGSEKLASAVLLRLSGAVILILTIRRVIRKGKSPGLVKILLP